MAIEVVVPGVPEPIAVEIGGLVGPQGDRGRNGADALSNYQLAVLYDGFTGGPSDYLASLVGADGAAGPPGPAPAGTGFVKVVDGVVQAPSPTIPKTAIPFLETAGEGTGLNQLHLNALGGTSGTLHLWSHNGFQTEIYGTVNQTAHRTLELPNSNGVLAVVSDPEGKIASSEIQGASPAPYPNGLAMYGGNGEITSKEKLVLLGSNDNELNLRLFQPLTAGARAANFPDQDGVVGILPNYNDSATANANVSVGDAWWDNTLKKVRVRLS